MYRVAWCVALTASDKFARVLSANCVGCLTIAENLRKARRTFRCTLDSQMCQYRAPSVHHRVSLQSEQDNTLTF